jgi:hypothetical protein
MRTIDIAALEAEGPRVQLLSQPTRVSDDGTGDPFIGFAGLSRLTAQIEVRRVSRTRPVTLTVLVEHSDDGSSWSTAASHTFDGPETVSASVSSPKDRLRVRWSLSSPLPPDEPAVIGSVSLVPGFLDEGGGGSFNGGTITQPVVIDTRPDNETIAFRVQAGDPSTSGIDILVDPSIPQVTIQGLDGFGTIVLSDDFTGGNLDLSSAGISLHQNGGSIYRQNLDGTAAVQLRSDGVWFAVHAGPADGDLNPGDCVLWFDQTDGAAKLMVKAKTEDGTVVTGSLGLV